MFFDLPKCGAVLTPCFLYHWELNFPVSVTIKLSFFLYLLSDILSTATQNTEVITTKTQAPFLHYLYIAPRQSTVLNTP